MKWSTVQNGLPKIRRGFRSLDIIFLYEGCVWGKRVLFCCPLRWACKKNYAWYLNPSLLCNLLVAWASIMFNICASNKFFGFDDQESELPLEGHSGMQLDKYRGLVKPRELKVNWKKLFWPNTIGSRPVRTTLRFWIFSKVFQKGWFIWEKRKNTLQKKLNFFKTLSTTPQIAPCAIMMKFFDWNESRKIY